MEDIDESWGETFQKHLRSKLSANAANTYFAKVKAALNLALKQRIISENPLRFIKPLKVGIINRPFLTFDELQILANAHCMDDKVRRAFLFACYTGLRLSDIKRLAWKDI